MKSVCCPPERRAVAQPPDVEEVRSIDILPPLNAQRGVIAGDSYAERPTTARIS
jgi:hypothetical protein